MAAPSRQYDKMKDDPLMAGKRLQLPVYALAVRETLLPDAALRAEYLFISANGGYTRVPVTLDIIEAQFRDTVQAIAEGVRGGVFPANPGPPGFGGPENCRYCDFQRICPTNKLELWARKGDSPQAAAYKMDLEASFPDFIDPGLPLLLGLAEEVVVQEYDVPLGFRSPDVLNRVERLFNQGINVRLINDEAAQALASVRFYDSRFTRCRPHTAWDNLGQEKIFFQGVDRLEAAGIPPRHLMVYMLVGYAPGETIEQVLHRHRRLEERGCRAFPMVYGENRELKDFQRWVVRRYSEFIPWQDYRKTS